MQDVGNFRYPGSLAQRLTYNFKSQQSDPSFGNSSPYIWTPEWSGDNKASIHLFAEPDKDVGNDHAVTALNDVVRRILQLDGPEFTGVYQKAPPSDLNAQDESLSEFQSTSPCGAKIPKSPINTANCMGIVVP